MRQLLVLLLLSVCVCVVASEPVNPTTSDKVEADVVDSTDLYVEPEFRTEDATPLVHPKMYVAPKGPLTKDAEMPDDGTEEHCRGSACGHTTAELPETHVIFAKKAPRLTLPKTGSSARFQESLPAFTDKQFKAIMSRPLKHYTQAASVGKPLSAAAQAAQEKATKANLRAASISKQIQLVKAKLKAHASSLEAKKLTDKLKVYEKQLLAAHADAVHSMNAVAGVSSTVGTVKSEVGELTTALDNFAAKRSAQQNIDEKRTKRDTLLNLRLQSAIKVQDAKLRHEQKRLLRDRARVMEMQTEVTKEQTVGQTALNREYRRAMERSKKAHAAAKKARQHRKMRHEARRKYRKTREKERKVRRSIRHRRELEAEKKADIRYKASLKEGRTKEHAAEKSRKKLRLAKEQRVKKHLARLQALQKKHSVWLEKHRKKQNGIAQSALTHTQKRLKAEITKFKHKVEKMHKANTKKSKSDVAKLHKEHLAKRAERHKKHQYSIKQLGTKLFAAQSQLDKEVKGKKAKQKALAKTFRAAAKKRAALFAAATKQERKDKAAVLASFKSAEKRRKAQHALLAKLRRANRAAYLKKTKAMHAQVYKLRKAEAAAKKKKRAEMWTKTNALLHHSYAAASAAKKAALKKATALKLSAEKATKKLAIAKVYAESRQKMRVFRAKHANELAVKKLRTKNEASNKKAEGRRKKAISAAKMALVKSRLHAEKKRKAAVAEGRKKTLRISQRASKKAQHILAKAAKRNEGAAKRIKRIRESYGKKLEKFRKHAKTQKAEKSAKHIKWMISTLKEKNKKRVERMRKRIERSTKKVKAEAKRKVGVKHEKSIKHGVALAAKEKKHKQAIEKHLKKHKARIAQLRKHKLQLIKKMQEMSNKKYAVRLKEAQSKSQAAMRSSKAAALAAKIKAVHTKNLAAVHKKIKQLRAKMFREKRRKKKLERVFKATPLTCQLDSAKSKKARKLRRLKRLARRKKARQLRHRLEKRAKKARAVRRKLKEATRKAAFAAAKKKWHQKQAIYLARVSKLSYKKQLLAHRRFHQRRTQWLLKHKAQRRRLERRRKARRRHRQLRRVKARKHAERRRKSRYRRLEKLRKRRRAQKRKLCRKAEKLKKKRMEVRTKAAAARRRAYIKVLRAWTSTQNKAKRHTYGKCLKFKAQISKKVKALRAACKKVKGTAVVECLWKAKAFRTNAWKTHKKLCGAILGNVCKKARHQANNRAKVIYAVCTALRGKARKKCKAHADSLTAKAVSSVARVCRSHRCALARSKYAKAVAAYSKSCTLKKTTTLKARCMALGKKKTAHLRKRKRQYCGKIPRWVSPCTKQQRHYAKRIRKFTASCRTRRTAALRSKCYTKLQTYTHTWYRPVGKACSSRSKCATYRSKYRHHLRALQRQCSGHTSYLKASCSRSKLRLQRRWTKLLRIACKKAPSKCKGAKLKAAKRIMAFHYLCRRKKGLGYKKCRRHLMTYRRLSKAAIKRACTKPTTCKAAKMLFNRRVSQLQKSCLTITGYARTQCYKGMHKHMTTWYKAVQKACKVTKKSAPCLKAHNRLNNRMTAAYKHCRGLKGNAVGTCYMAVRRKLKIWNRQVKQACARRFSVCKRMTRLYHAKLTRRRTKCLGRGGNRRYYCHYSTAKFTEKWTKRLRTYCNKSRKCVKAKRKYTGLVVFSNRRCAAKSGHHALKCLSKAHRQAKRWRKSLKRACRKLSVCKRALSTFHRAMKTKSKHCNRLKGYAKVKCRRALKGTRNVLYAKHVGAKCKNRSRRCVLAKASYKRKLARSRRRCKKLRGAKRKRCWKHYKQSRKHLYVRMVRVPCSTCTEAGVRYKRRVKRFKGVCRKQGRHQKACLKALAARSKLWKRAVSKACYWTRHAKTERAMKAKAKERARKRAALQKRIAAAKRKRAEKALKAHKKRMRSEAGSKAATSRHHKACGAAKKRYFHLVHHKAKRCLHKSGAARKSCMAHVKRSMARHYTKVKTACTTYGHTQCRNAKKAYFKKAHNAGVQCMRKGAKAAACVKTLKTRMSVWYVKVLAQCNKKCVAAHHSYKKKMALASLVCLKTPRTKTNCYRALAKNSKKWMHGVTAACKQGLKGHLAKRALLRAHRVKKNKAKCKAAKHTFKVRMHAQVKHCTRLHGHGRKRCFRTLLRHRKVWYRAVKSACVLGGSARCVLAKKTYRRKFTAAHTACRKKKGAARTRCFRALKVSKGHWYSSVTKACFSKKAAKHHKHRCKAAKKTYKRRMHSLFKRCKRLRGSSRTRCYRSARSKRKVWYRSVRKACVVGGSKRCIAAKASYRRRFLRAHKACRRRRGAARSRCFRSLRRNKKVWYRSVRTACK